MISVNPTKNPGSTQSFAKIAPGEWNVVYAPHITVLSSLAGGKFDPIIYDMRKNGTIISHARYNFPLLGEGWLSTSGTYGSEDEKNICRIDFDHAWIDVSDTPIKSFEKVPETWYKGIVDIIGQYAFINEFAVFPVSYLDQNTIVFDFELLGTRICARKIN